MSSNASDVVNMGKSAPASRPKANQVLVFGKIESVEQYEGRVYTRMTTPASDEYAKPGSVSIRSNRRLGDKDTELEVMCYVGGWERTFTLKDGGKGIRTTVTLDAIEG